MTDDAHSSPFPLIAAHRGGAGLWPENSLTAFRGAVELGVDLIEFDVHLSRDGEVVVIHDPTLERTTDGKGAVADRDFLQLPTLTLKGSAGERIPLLGQVIDIVRATPVGLRMEVKVRVDMTPYPGLEAKLVERLAGAGMLERTVVTSFAWETLKRFGTLASPAGFIGLVRRDAFTEAGGLEAALKMVRDAGLPEIGIHVSRLTADSVARAREMGLRLGVYGANGREEIEKALELGVSVFTTNRPDWAVAFRKQRYSA